MGDADCFSTVATPVCEAVEAADGVVQVSSMRVVDEACDVYVEEGEAPSCFSQVACAPVVSFEVDHCFAVDACPDEVVMGTEALASGGLLYDRPSQTFVGIDGSVPSSTWAFRFVQLRNSPFAAASPGFFLQLDDDVVVHEATTCTPETPEGRSESTLWSGIAQCQPQMNQQRDDIDYLAECFLTVPPVPTCGDEATCEDDLECIPGYWLCLKPCATNVDCADGFVCENDGEQKLCLPDV